MTTWLLIWFPYRVAEEFPGISFNKICYYIKNKLKYEKECCCFQSIEEFKWGGFSRLHGVVFVLNLYFTHIKKKKALKIWEAASVFQSYLKAWPAASLVSPSDYCFLLKYELCIIIQRRNNIPLSFCSWVSSFISLCSLHFLLMLRAHATVCFPNSE